MIRKLALVGVAVVTVAACGSNSPDSQSQPAWVGSEQSLTPTPVPSPSTPVPPPASSSSSATASSSSSPGAKVEVTYTFPVIGKNSYAHTHHDYAATDVITACGHRFVAVTSGVVLAVTRKDTWTAKVNDGATRGGLSISIKGDDGVRYYGSHLSAIDPAVKVGARVKTGQTLGKTGDTGDASACHLHFGISPPCAGQGDWWTQRGAVYPWPYLDSWKAGGQKSPVAAVKTYKQRNGCPTKPRADP